MDIELDDEPAPRRNGFERHAQTVLAGVAVLAIGGLAKITMDTQKSVDHLEERTIALSDRILDLKDQLAKVQPAVDRATDLLERRVDDLDRRVRVLETAPKK